MVLRKCGESGLLSAMCSSMGDENSGTELSKEGGKVAAAPTSDFGGGRNREGGIGERAKAKRAQVDGGGGHARQEMIASFTKCEGKSLELLSRAARE
jgi:hypothetical protein